MIKFKLLPNLWCFSALFLCIHFNLIASSGADSFSFSNFRFSYIERNNGILPDKDVQYFMRSSNATLFFKKDKITYQFVKKLSENHNSMEIEQISKEEYKVLNLEVSLLNSSKNSAMHPGAKLGSVTNYFIGNDSSQWKSGQSNFGELSYSNIYSGIDIVYYNKSGSVKYDFVIHANANLSQIKLKYKGVSGKLKLNEKGELIIPTTFGNFTENIPLAFQIINGERKIVNATYALNKDNSIGFNVSEYNPIYPLIIDPALQFSTYIGGSNTDVILLGQMAHDNNNNIYVTGNTTSTNFPTTAGVFDISQNGNEDAFIFKLNSSGTTLLYSTFIGGNDLDYGLGIGLDPAGNVYLAGDAWSMNFPTTSGTYQSAHSIGSFGNGDIFVTKFNSNCSSIIWGTFIGGSLDEQAHEVAIASNGNVYTAGQAFGSLPTTPGVYQTSNHGDYDYFVSILNPNGTALIASTFVGGTGRDRGTGIVLDANNNIYLSGYTPAGFPTTPGAFDVSYNGGIADVAVCKLNPNCTNLIYSTYLGSSGDDIAKCGLEISPSGEAVIVGGAGSSNFPRTAGAYLASFGAGGSDAFLTKINSSGSALVYSTYFGGNSSDVAYDLSIASNGEIAITGEAGLNYPVTQCAYDKTFNGGSTDAFVTVFDLSASIMIYSTFIGGLGNDGGRTIYFENDLANVFGNTSSINFPTTSGGYDNSYNGSSNDIMAFQLDISGSPATAPIITSVNTACTGSNVNFSSTPFNSYYWNFGDSLSGSFNTSVLQNQNHIFLHTGTYTIKLIVSGACVQDTVTKQITITQVPTVSASADTTICDGQQISLSASGGATYQWTGAISSTAQSILISPHTNSTYIVKAKNGVCTSLPDTINVTVLTLPTVSLLGDTSICMGNQAQLVASTVGGSSIIWSSPIISSNDTVQVSPNATTTYYVSTSNGVCNSLKDSIVVAVLTIPVPSFSTPTTTCFMTSISFTNATVGSSSFTWNFGDPSSGLQNFSNASNPSHSFASPNSYIISLAAQNLCGMATTTDTIVIQTGPNVAIVDSVRICNGQQTTLTASGGTSYQWSGAITSTSPSIIVNPITQSTYIVKASNGVCFGAPDTMIVYVSPLPFVSLIGDSTICVGNSAQLVASAGGGSTIIWSSPIISSNDTVNISPITTTTYYVSASNGVCTSQTDSLLVKVLTVPVPSFINQSNPCSLTPISFTNTTVGSPSYLWNFGDPGSGVLNTSTLTNPSHQFSTSSTYTISLTASNTCGSITSNLPLTFLNGPNVLVDPDKTICLGDQVTLNASGGISYQWSGGITSTNSTVQVSPSVSSTYIVKAFDGNCFGKPDTVIVNPVPKPIVSILGKNSACTGESITLVGTGASNFSWTGDIISTNAMVTFLTVNSINCTLTGSTGDCFSDPVPYNLTVSNPTTAFFTYNLDTCSGEFYFTNLSTFASNYLWNFDDGIQSQIENPIHTFDLSGDYNITLITNPGNYCTDTFQVTIPFEQIIDGLLFIPNCFTPNGDGLNDNFVVNSNNTCKYLTLEIYNRWGQLIFETVGYQLKWDGKTKFGSSPDGVYVYRIQSSAFEKVGHITLLR